MNVFKKIKSVRENRFFTKLDWASFWTATLVTFAVYFYTLGPSVGLEDSGELATAGAHLGVPHPPGYPFWTLCSWIFCKIFSFVTYMGHPTPAWAVSCFSAVAGAFAAGFTAMLICRSSRDFVNDGDSADGTSLFSSTTSVVAFAGGVAGALTFSLSPVEWSQSTIVEIYSLNAFFLMAVFLLSYRWMRRPSDRILWFTAFVFGLGLTNYQVLLFAIVPLALVILFKNIGMFRDVFIYLAPVALTYQILDIGQLQRSSFMMNSDVIAKHLPVGVAESDWVRSAVFGANSVDPEKLVPHASCPYGWMVALAIAAVVVGIVGAIYLSRRRRDIERALKCVLFVSGGGAALLFVSATVFTHSVRWEGVAEEFAPLLSPSVYALVGAFVAGSAALAVAASLADRENFISARNAKFVVPAIALALAAVITAAVQPSAHSISASYGGKLLAYSGEAYNWTRSTLLFLLVLVILFTLSALTRRRRALLFAIPVAGLQIAAFTLLKAGAMNGLTHPSTWWFLWPVAWNFVVLALVWAILPFGRSVAGAAFFTQLGVSFYAYMPLVSDWRNPPMNWGYPRTWEGFKHAITRGQYEQIAFKWPTKAQMLNYLSDVRVQFTDVLIPFAIAPFAIGCFAVKRKNQKAFWLWMIPAFICFLMMSVLLIALADVKGDLQDGFIQKVKFISSHAMLALWIGYGLVFAVIVACNLMRPKYGAKKTFAFALVASVAMVVVSFVYPVIDNYVGDYRLGVNEVAFKLGGNEQNGHTFGWQFGAYQLDGAKAIREQLSDDEEPLPDPNWPEPMEMSSIFFGGTDPGRFVPTYMIYSANYRPDVYLITQNALADDTYMSVERDLYGDEIWIPSKEDSAEAFNRYVEEVKSGKRAANGDLKIENGRVQVTGALGVMEINGILTEMMFEHDRTRHDFYVEESYVIQWMYPYLSPHGLIMKINRDKKPYDAKTAARDADFWDWYVRRLLEDPMFRRDFAAQKSFSKLRAAIAGLYTRQARYAESGQAFRESCLLYPASPEASFRYCQENLLPMRKFDIVSELMDYTDYLDPNNRRTEAPRSYVRRVTGLQTEMARLHKLCREGQDTTENRIALARCYIEAGRGFEAVSLLKGLHEKISDADQLRDIGEGLSAVGMLEDAEKWLSRYVSLAGDKVQPDEWMTLAKIQHRLGRSGDAARSFITGYQKNPKAMYKRVLEEKDLREIAEPLFRQASESKR